MPTFDWKCDNCGKTHEAIEPITATSQARNCPHCNGCAWRQFTPTTNISIPGHFKLDRGWHLPQSGSEAGSADLNNRVHAPKKTSFREQFDKNWKSIGGS